MVFEGVDEPALRSITQADRAIPGATDQEWGLENVVVWSPTGGQVLFPERHDRLVLQFPLRLAHLEYHDIWSFYLTNAALRQIATLEGSPKAADGQTAVARRYLSLFLPGVFALLGASLAQAARSGRLIAWWRLLALGTLGYVTLVSVKAFWSLGEIGTMAPLPATTAPLVFALVLVMILQIRMNGLPGRR
jgi:lipopolysaccharide export LptBFGC system permease protein LptF